jgi:protein-tyrosine phosphatase
MDFDYVLVMDEENLESVKRLAKGKTTRAQIKLLREFDAQATNVFNVPDPYYGGPRGFENVHDIVERSCAAFLEQIRADHQL